MYRKVRIQDFVDFASKQDKEENVVHGNVGWVDIDINRSRNYLDKIINFDKSDIGKIKEINFKNKKYSLLIEENFIEIKDMDYDRKSINPNYKNWNGKRYGNVDVIWIYKIEDDWFLSIIARSNIIPFHINPYIMANRNSNFEFYKCDQIDGLIKFLKEKIK